MFQNKKKVAALAAMAGLVLSGFAAVSPAQAVAPTLLIWADETRGPNLIKALGTLEDQRVGQWVAGYKIEVVSSSNFDALKASMDNATALTGPDIVLGANSWVPAFAQNGKVAPLTVSASVKKNFNPNQFADLSYKGKLYGIPLDINNVAMMYNKALVSKAPKTFGDMVSVYKAKKVSKNLTAGLCIAGGGMSWGAHSVLSALGGAAFQMKNGKVVTKGNPTNVTAFTANVKKYLLNPNGTSNGFFPASDTGCKDNFLAGKVPYAVIGSWEWAQYEEAGFSMNTIMPVPGVKAGTYGQAFGSVSGALLTSFAATHGKAAAAKSFLTGFFGSASGASLYERYEKRPPANKNATFGVLAGASYLGKAAGKASVPEIGAILNGVSKSYWDSLPALWTAILVEKKNVKTEATKFNAIMKTNVVAGAKTL